MAKIDEYFTMMKEQGASDLHMVIGFPPLLRLRGDLVPLNAPVLTAESNKEILFEILDANQQEAIEKNKDLDKAYALDGVGRFRCIFSIKKEALVPFFVLFQRRYSHLISWGCPML